MFQSSDWWIWYVCVFVGSLYLGACVLVCASSVDFVTLLLLVVKCDWTDVRYQLHFDYSSKIQVVNLMWTSFVTYICAVLFVSLCKRVWLLFFQCVISISVSYMYMYVGSKMQRVTLWLCLIRQAVFTA